VIGRYNDQTFFSTKWKQFSCLPFDLQTKVKEKPLGVWGERIYQYLQRPTSLATLSAKQILPHPENLPAEVGFQKQHHSMPHVGPVGRLTSAYILKPADESNLIFPSTTKLKLSVKIKHFSAG
jgi:hypothetical protein